MHPRTRRRCCGNTYLDLAVLARIFIGWVIAFAVVISAHVIFCDRTDHER